MRKLVSIYNRQRCSLLVHKLNGFCTWWKWNEVKRITSSSVVKWCSWLENGANCRCRRLSDSLFSMRQVGRWCLKDIDVELSEGSWHVVVVVVVLSSFLVCSSVAFSLTVELCRFCFFLLHFSPRTLLEWHYWQTRGPGWFACQCLTRTSCAAVALFCPTIDSFLSFDRWFAV